MKPFKSYKTAKPISENEKLPPGGYIIQILSAEEITYTWGRVLEIRFDIAEGEFKSYYTNQYKNSQLGDKKYKGIYRMNVAKDDGSDLDNFTASRFLSDMIAVEESNPSFHWAWDEKQLIGKKVGAVFFEKEYDFQGNQGFFTTLHSFRSIDTIKNNKFKVPKPKMLNKASTQNNYHGFATVSDATDDDLPF